MGYIRINLSIENISADTDYPKFALFTAHNHTVTLKIVELLFHEVFLYKTKISEYNHTTIAFLFETMIAELLNTQKYSLLLAADRSKSSANNIVQYIVSNYKTVTLEQVAKHFNYSVSYTSKVIKQRLGMGFSAFIIGYKLNEVCKLLSTTDNTITKAATACGFNNMDYFYRQFKKEIGVTPTEFRRRQNKRL